MSVNFSRQSWSKHITSSVVTLLYFRNWIEGSMSLQLIGCCSTWNRRNLLCSSFTRSFLFSFFNTIEICKSFKKLQTVKNPRHLYKSKKTHQARNVWVIKRGYCSFSCTTEGVILNQMQPGWFSNHLCFISFKPEIDPNLKSSCNFFVLCSSDRASL